MSSFKEQMSSLVKLQNKEIEISRIERELAGIDERVNALNLELTEFQERVAGQEAKLADLKKQYRSQEGEVQMIESMILKSKQKLGAVKTNKEYQSTLKEIDDLKEKASGIEDLMLAALDEIESGDKDLIEYRDDLADVEREVREKQAEIHQNAEKQGEELVLLKRQRDEVRAATDDKLHARYERVKQQSNGIAIAAIVEGVCQACRINIPPQLFNELLRMDSLKMCPNCQRIMYPKAALDNV